MKKILNKICSAFLFATLLFSAVACGGESGSNSSSSSGSVNGDNTQIPLKEQIYTDGVHVYDYTETDKYVVQNGQSDYKIVISATASSFESLAANELVLFFEEATGVTLPVVSDSAITYNQNSKVICLGKNEYYRSAYSLNDNLSTDGKNLEHDGFMIETVGNGIYIFGDYAEGALFGVYRYLALEFNYDCYSNTAYYLDTGVRNVTLKDFSVIDVPDYRFRSVRFI